MSTEVEITVKTLDSKNHVFKLSDESTVREFKEKISDTVAIVAESQRLIYCGRVLQDDKKLSEYGLDQKVVHLVQKMPPRTPGSGGGGGSGTSSTPRPSSGSTTERSNSARRPTSNQPRTARIGGGNGMYLGAVAFPHDFMMSGSNIPSNIHAPEVLHAAAHNRIQHAHSMLRRGESCIRRMRTLEQQDDGHPTATIPPEEASGAAAAAATAPASTSGSNEDSGSPDNDESTDTSFEDDVVPPPVHVIPGANTATVEIVESTPITINMASNNSGGHVSPQSIAEVINAIASGLGDALGAGSNITVVQQRNRVGSPSPSPSPPVERESPTNESSSSTRATASQTATPPPLSSETIPSTAEASTTTTSDTPTREAGENTRRGNARSRRSTRTPVSLQTAANVLQHLLNFQDTFRPHVERLIRLLRDDPELDPQNPQNEETRNRQLLFNTVSESLHYLSHATHCLSDLGVSFNRRPPRPVTVRSLVLQPTAVLQAGIPVQARVLSAGGGNRSNNSTTTTSNTNANTNTTTTNATSTANVNTSTRSTTVGIPIFDSDVEVFMEVTPTISIEASASPTTTQSSSTTTTSTTTATTNARGAPPLDDELAAELRDDFDNISDALDAVFRQYSESVVSGSSMSGGPISLSVGSGPEVVFSRRIVSERPPTSLLGNRIGFIPRSRPTTNTTSNNETTTAASSPRTPTGQQSQARGNTTTQPTTATHTRSTTRPHVQFAHLSGSQSFDPYLPCQSAHVQNRMRMREATARQFQRGGNSSTRNRVASARISSIRPRPHVTASITSVFNPLGVFSGSPLLSGGTNPGRHEFNFLRSLMRVVSNQMNSQTHAEFFSLFQMPLREFVNDELLNNVAYNLNTSSIDQPLEYCIRTAEPYLASVRNSQLLRRDVDFNNTIREYLRAKLPAIIHTILREDLNGNEFGVTIYEMFRNNFRDLAILTLMCCHGGGPSLERILFRLIQIFLNDTEVGITGSPLRIHLRRYIERLPSHSAELEGYIVRTSVSQPLVLPQVSTPSTATAVISPPVTQAEVSPQPSEEAMECDEEPVLEPSHSVETVQQTLPQLQVENTCDVVVGSENWHSNIDSSQWVPVIARDVQRQRRQPDQRPFSDAYLAGVSSKRRKLINNAKPQGNTVERVLSDTFARASTASGSEHLANAVASDENIQNAYRNEVNETVRKELERNPDFTPDRFPNANKYFKPSK